MGILCILSIHVRLADIRLLLVVARELRAGRRVWLEWSWRSGWRCIGDDTIGEGWL